MKKIFTFFLVLVTSMGIVYASDTQVDGIWYDFDSNNHTASVTYRGFGYSSSYNEYFGEVIIPENVTYNGITYSVTSIGDGAFKHCYGLSSVTIPNSVTSIGDYAFEDCSGLTSVTIPNSVTSIGDYAFEDCSGLTSITIPNSVTSIGRSAFYRCSSLTSVTIPNSVISIGDFAFALCNDLTSVTIPNSVTSIGDFAFAYCSSLTSITIPNSVTTMGGAVFCGCSSLTSVMLSENMTSIKTYIDCPQESPFCYIFGFFDGCSSLTSITIPKSVTSIGIITFKYCSSLKLIIIPDNVTTLGEGLFYGCSSLESVVFSKNIQYIPSSHSVDNWEYFGFFGECHSLREITMMAQSPVTVSDGAFADIPNDIAVYVPCGMVSSYKEAKGWDYFTNIQEPLAEYSIAVGVNDRVMGTAKVDKNTMCGDGSQISATANYGYHFVRWSDGNTENPRTLVLTQDTTFTAEFAQTYSGQCGDNLYWSYKNSSLTISGFGDMYNKCPWGLFENEIQSVVLPKGITHIGNKAFSNCTGLSEITIPNTVTSIGNYTFYGCSGLTSITIPNSVTSIGYSAFADCSSLTYVSLSQNVATIEESTFSDCEKLGTVILGSGLKEIEYDAFKGCKKLYDIYCYSPEPPIAVESSFTNYNVNLYVPCESLRDYQMDMLFGSFKYIQCISSEDVSTEDNIVVTPGSNDVTITWPTEDEADTYSIVITKDGEVFCTLTFNSNGQLVNIAFVPGREGNHPAQYAEATTNGYRFTVTGLEESTKYGYNLDVKDDSSKTIKSYNGEFTTQSTTAVDEIQSTTNNVEKIFLDGQLLIIRDGKTYNAQGAAL